MGNINDHNLLVSRFYEKVHDFALQRCKWVSTVDLFYPLTRIVIQMGPGSDPHVTRFN